LPQFEAAVRKEADIIAAARDRLRAMISDAEDIADSVTEAHDNITSALDDIKRAIEKASEYL
jgi:hypothetical protein